MPAASFGHRIPFAVSLFASWFLLTPAIALAFRNGDRTWENLLSWTAIWFFSVIGPTIEALGIHRNLSQLTAVHPEAAAAMERGLGRLRWTLLMFGTMTVITAFGLGLGR